MLSNISKIIFVVTCSLTAAINSAYAGDSRGGGDTVPQNLASKEAIKAAILEVKPNLSLLYKSWEFLASSDFWSGDNNNPTKKTFDKLFNQLDPSGQKHTVLDEIEIFDFDIREKGPCKDLDGKDVDASAFNTDPKKICFSLERLSQKLSTDNMDIQILALATHEVSHRVGTTEPEAVMLQLMALKKTTFKNYFNLIMQEEDIQAKYDAVIASTEAILKSLDSKHNEPQTCFAISTLNSNVAIANKIFDTTIDDSVVVLFPFGSNLTAKSLAFKAFNASSYCFNENNKDKIAIKSIFGGREKIPVSEFYKTLYLVASGKNDSELAFIQFDKATVSYIRGGDRKTLRSEILEIQAEAKQLRASIY